MQLFGSTGTIALPDPNTFGGAVRVRGRNAEDWDDIKLDPGHDDNARGLGLVELAAAIRGEDTRITSGAAAAHVLDAMLATLRAGETGIRQNVDG